MTCAPPPEPSGGDRLWPLTCLTSGIFGAVLLCPDRQKGDLISPNSKHSHQNALNWHKAEMQMRPFSHFPLLIDRWWQKAPSLVERLFISCSPSPALLPVHQLVSTASSQISRSSGHRAYTGYSKQLGETWCNRVGTHQS